MIPHRVRRSLGTRRLAACGLLILSGSILVRPLASQSRPDFLAANIDPTVSPRDDFFQYATGAWLKRHPIPPDQGRWGVWNVVSDDLYARLRAASEAASASRARRGSVGQLIGDFWATGMDSIAVNRQGLAPLRPDLERITRIRSIGDVMEIVALLHRRNMLAYPGGLTAQRILFSAGVERDERNASRRILSLTQGGISLGAQAYTGSGAQRARVREAFREYLFKTFLRLDGDSGTARTRAEVVFDLETALASAFSPANEFRMVDLTELSQMTPAIDWKRYFAGIGATGLDSVNVRKPRFYQALDSLLRTTPLESWRSYLQAALVRAHAPFLDDATFNDLFAFQSVSTGATQPLPRWRRVIWQEKNWLGQPLAQLFVKEYFPPSVKAHREALADALKQALANRIAQSDWMSEGTRQNALHKLGRLTITVGFPEPRLDVSTMPLRRDSYVLNMVRSAEWFHALAMRQLHAPVKPTEPDPHYNVGGDAYYDDNANAAFLPSPGGVPGWRHAELDDAFLYGGTSLGHEISHGFDSEGRHYDAYGNKIDWWTARDDSAFRQRAQVMVEQYNDFTPVEGLRVNGQRSLRENVADLLGLRITLDAFKRTEQFRRNERIAGFTPLQRFFLAYAYSHMGHERPEFLAARINGAYAPDRERVNGVVANIDEFYEAFGIQPGDRMYRAEKARVKIWP